MTPTNAQLKAMGWTPQLHLVACRNFCFDLVLENGEVRSFAIFTQNIEAYPLLIVHYDPELPEEVNVFGSLESRNGFHSKAIFLGTALPLRVKLPGQKSFSYHRMLHELNPRHWYDAHQLAEQKPCYLRDEKGRLAFGYKDSQAQGGWAIISGPDQFIPMEFQNAEPIEPAAQPNSNWDSAIIINLN